MSILYKVFKIIKYISQMATIQNNNSYKLTNNFRGKKNNFNELTTNFL